MSNLEKMTDLLKSVQVDLGTFDAKEIIKQIGGVEKLSLIPEDRQEAVIAECQRVLSEYDAENKKGAAQVAANLAPANLAPANNALSLELKAEYVFLHTPSEAVLAAAHEQLAKLPEDMVSLRVALATIYNAWIAAGFMPAPKTTNDDDY